MYNQENELKHYGVLGMKWGRRRQLNRAARDRQLSGDSRSRRAIRNELRNDRRLRDKFARRYGVDSRVVSKLDRQGAGKTAVKVFGLGSYGALKYDQSRTGGKGRGRSFVKGGLGRMGNSLLPNVPSIIDGSKSRSTNKYSDKTRVLKSEMKKSKEKYKTQDKITGDIVERYMKSPNNKTLNDRMWAEGEKTYRARKKYKNAKNAYKQSKRKDKAQWRESKRNIHR